MADNKILITAGLDIPQSVNTITKDLKQVTNKLNANQALTITANIDIGKTTQQIQSQLSDIGKDLKIDVGTINAQSIKNSINEAVKIEPVKIDVQAQIDSGDIKRQAKEFKEYLGIDFAGESKESIKALNAQLQEMLANYDKAVRTSDFNEMMSSWEKLSGFANDYANTLKNITPEMEKINGILKGSKIFISSNNYKELETIFGKGEKGAIKRFIDNALGIGKWSYDSRKASYPFDSLVKELNSNLYGDDSVNKISESVVEGLEKIATLRHADVESAREWDRQLEEILGKDAMAWERYKEAVLDSLYSIRGEQNPASQGFIEIITEEEIERSEKNVEIFKNGIKEIANLKAEYMSQEGVKSVTADWTQDAARNLEGFIINVTKANGEVERFKHTVNEEGGFDLTRITGSDKGSLRFLEQVSKEANKLERQLINIKSQADDLAHPRPITSQEGINTVEQAYNRAIEAVEKLRQADATTFAELDNEALKARDNLENVIRSQRNLETAATKLRAKPIEVIREEELRGLEEFVATISKSAIPDVEELTERVNELRNSLAEIKDKKGLADFLDKFSILESDFTAINVQAMAVKSTLTELNRIAGNRSFAQNSQNTNVQTTLADVNKLKEEYQKIFDTLGKDVTPAKLQEISARLAELKPKFEEVKQSAAALNQELADNTQAQRTTDRFNTLINQVEKFGNTYKDLLNSSRKMRSGVTFGEEFDRIMTALSSENLDDNSLRQLAIDFRNLKGEANAVQNATSGLFSNMGSQIQMLVSRWLSLYAIIGKIKQMITYVIELDDAMTKLKRVTDETAKGYERFLEVAKKSAKETNTTLVDTVEQAAKWAKSGYDAATSAELAKTSLIYSIVGDIDNDTAVSDLVTALRGFRMEAEDAMSIVDKLDALNNKYATDAKSLGEALTVSASAMANAGNNLDQTLALITGATEITQNAKETGQAIRTITMRIRGMKGELEELGEESDGIESISKIQTQILNYTKGKVNIFDQNNEFKSTYQILKEISEVYNDLTQTDQAALTEVLFGKLRSNQGLAIISAFQSGQIEKAFKDASNSAGTATEEMTRYAESISGHINLFKEAVQELSADLIDGEIVKSVIDQGKELIELLDHLVKDIKEIKDLVPQSLKDIYAVIKDNPIVEEILSPVSFILDKYKEIRGLIKDEDLLVSTAPEGTQAIDSLRDRYIELTAEGENVKEMSEQLKDMQENLNDKYKDASKAVDILNKSLGENLAITDKLKKEEAGKWLEENAEDYRKAAEELEKVSKIELFEDGTFGSGDTYKFNATGLKRFTDAQYKAFESLGLSNFYDTRGTGMFADFLLSGTLQEQIDSLIKIRDIYSTLEDKDDKRLRQMDNEIEALQDKVAYNKQLLEVLKEQERIYRSQDGDAQKYNMIDQAVAAYDAYKKAMSAGNGKEAQDALKMLITIKQTLYSVTEPTDLVRQDFNDLWATFTLGAEEALSSLDEVRQRFAEVKGDEFDATIKTLADIEKAVESLMGGELLSHEDAWKLINIDTEGVLTDIEIIGNKYKLNTDQIMKLMQQQIEKQKESILVTKEQAQQELNLLNISLRHLKVNSAADVSHYNRQVASIRAEMEDMQEIIDQSDYLLMELNGHLSVTSKLADSTAKSLNNAIKQYEAEIEAIDDTIDSLNDRKDILEEEKSALQDQLDILNEQKSVLEETIKNYDTVAGAVSNYVKTITEGIQEQIDALEEERKEIEDYYDKQIDALQKQNDERDLAIQKEKALADLANAQNQKKRVYSSARGWTYESDKEAILNAQNALDEVVNNEQIQALEKEREEKLTGFDERKTAYEKQIEAYEEYAEKYAEVASDIQKAEADLLAEQILGSKWREDIEKKDEGLLTNYKTQYQQFNVQLNNLVKNEINLLQESIDKKDEEIKKISDEISAYNKYKTTVQKAMKNAEEALKNYQTAMKVAKTDITSAISTMEETYRTESEKVSSYNSSMASSTESARDRMVSAIRDAGNAISGFYNDMERRLLSGEMNLADYVRMLKNGSFANGGTIDYTGLAMVHGSKIAAETAFSATDSKKLYEFIHDTPNIMASMVKQASHIAGFNAANVRNNTANNINVNIGQVVANNPQELTRNLDKTLDGYFRQKLTQSYVQ